MTEKRFTIEVENRNYENAFYDNVKEEFICFEDDYDSILQLLNALHEENERLKKELHISDECETISIETSLHMSDEIAKLEKENKQLKRNCKNYEWYKEYKRLLNENEQLKELLKEVEHELTSLTGLTAFDKCEIQLGYVEVFDEDRIELDYSNILRKIDKI